MLGEYDLNPPGGDGRPGDAADEHDGAVARARGRAAAARRRQRRLARGCAARSCRSSSTSSATACASRRRSPRRASTSTTATSTARAAPTRPSSTSSSALGYDVVRWRRRNLYFGGASAVELLSRRHPRRRRRPAPRRPRRRRAAVSDWLLVRPAGPADAAALVGLADEVAAEPEGWLVTDDAGGAWATSGATCAASARYPHAAVFVAEAPAGSSAGSRSRATRIRRAPTSPTSG